MFEDEIARLRELEAPEESAAALDRYLGAREEAIGFLEDGLAAARQEDAAAYAQAQADVADGQVERAELAQQVGFSACSRPLSGGAGAPPSG